MLDTVSSIPNIEREYVRQMLKDLPENHSMFKCHVCKTIFDIFSGGEGISILIALSDKNNVICPKCKSDNTELMCKVDAYSAILKIKGFNCRKGTVISGVDICPICRDPMCPECYNHSVVSLSRVTGYIQDVSGWNTAKKQELEDRKRYVIRI